MPMPSSVDIKVEVLSLGGQRQAFVKAKANWRCIELLAMMRETGILAPGTQARILHGHSQLTNRASLEDIGVRNGSQLTLIREPSMILTTSKDCTAKVWNPENGQCVFTFQGHHRTPIESALFSPDGQQLLTIHIGDTMKVWCVASGTCSFTLTPSTVAVNIAQFSPNGQQVLTAGGLTMLSLWSSVCGKHLRTFGHPHRCIIIASFSPDGNQVLEVSDDRTPRLWCAASGEFLASFYGHVGRVNSAIFSPDEKSLLTASADTTAKLWSIDSGECARTIEAHAHNVITADLSEDGKQIITADFCFVIKVWTTPFDQCHLTISDVDNLLELRFAAFSSESQQLLTTSSDRKARVWCTETGKCLNTFENNDGQVMTATFFRMANRCLQLLVWRRNSGALSRGSAC